MQDGERTADGPDRDALRRAYQEAFTAQRSVQHDIDEAKVREVLLILAIASTPTGTPQEQKDVESSSRVAPKAGGAAPASGTSPTETPPPDTTDDSDPPSPNASMQRYAREQPTRINPLTNQPEPNGPDTQADHIVPQDLIKKDPRYDLLKRDQKSAVLNTTKNTQPLQATFNASKGAKPPGAFTTWKGNPLDPNFVKGQVVLGNQAWSHLESMMNAFLEANKGPKF